MHHMSVKYTKFLQKMPLNVKNDVFHRINVSFVGDIECLFAILTCR